MDDDDTATEELGASELGTQQYWNGRYKTEIKNYEHHGDPGEIWFGEDIVDRIVTWLDGNESIDKSVVKLIDIGCGNGMFLIQLAAAGYTNLHGTDYSSEAITLARAIAEKHKYTGAIKYYIGDVLVGLPGGATYDVIHDKGTFDAVSLMSDPKQSRCKYLRTVHDSLHEHGWFIITSCNWTKEELDRHFNEHFRCVDVIPTPQFRFGGKVGNVVTCLVYRKL